MGTTAADMKGYEQMLLQHTPPSSLDTPVTEIVIFKLAQDPTPQTRAAIEQDFIANSSKGEGVNRTAWGYSLDDPRTVVIMFDWRKIQDHWTFWQTPAFEPVIKCIETVFEPGRPLVRHYKFDPVGMVGEEYVQVMVWDEGQGQEERGKEEMEGKVKSKGQNWSSRKGGFAVDINEMTWYCTLLGYSSEAAAREDGIEAKGASHLVKLTYVPGKE
ncbi:hypothetical protein FQN50_004268 [Emmonsiellopsis sp. PD_5]|nr:hypothetical protein FQN50_004268 [Emmonsiellopsis sp. PD_5]